MQKYRMNELKKLRENAEKFHDSEAKFAKI